MPLQFWIKIVIRCVRRYSFLFNNPLDCHAKIFSVGHAGTLKVFKIG